LRFTIGASNFGFDKAKASPKRATGNLTARWWFTRFKGKLEAKPHRQTTTTMLIGIDTSRYTTIDLQRLCTVVKKHRLYFNFIKATEGVTLQDRKFLRLWEMSRKAGLLCGAYHFFRPLTDVAGQVSNFVSHYKKVDGTGALPPVLDIEWATARKVEQWAKVPPRQRVHLIRECLSSMEAALGVKPIIYTAPAFWKEFIEPASSPADDQYFSTYSLWVVDLKKTGRVPRPWKGQKPPFVQVHFGEHATTPEDFDKLDQNRFNGTLKDLLQYLAPGFTLAKGAPFSPMVMTLQAKLIEKGYLSGKADGLFGPKTESAVRAFQQASGLPVDGVIGAKTWKKLL
jgi:lysozyme